MANFTQHVNQATKNLSFLSQINNQVSESWDWQVTAAFYVAVHLVNAHLADKLNMHYKTHFQVEEIINPFNEKAPKGVRFSEETYLSFKKLHNLSRRSRYLIHEKKQDKEDIHFLTYDKHLLKAIYHLDIILKYLNKIHKLNIPICQIKCLDKRPHSFQYFTII